MTSPVTWEYLGDAEQAPRGRRRRGLVTLGILGLVMLAAGLVWWSDHVRVSATEQLAVSYAEAQQVARAGEGRVLSTLAYASPMIGSSAVGEDVRAGLRALVQESAAEVVTRLAGVRAQVAGATVLPWQESQERARVAVLAVIDQESQRFSAVAADARNVASALGGGSGPTAAVRQALQDAGAG